MKVRIATAIMSAEKMLVVCRCGKFFIRAEIMALPMATDPSRRQPCMAAAMPLFSRKTVIDDFMPIGDRVPKPIQKRARAIKSGIRLIIRKKKIAANAKPAKNMIPPPIR